MRTVARHGFNRKLVQGLAAAADNTVRIMRQRPIAPGAISALAEREIAAAQLSAGLLPESPEVAGRIVPGLTSGARLLAGLFALARGGGEQGLELPRADGGFDVALAGTVSPGGRSLADWWRGMWAALAVGDRFAAQVLASTPLDAIRSPGTSGLPWIEPFVEAVQAMVAGDPQFPGRLRRALEATDPAGLAPTDARTTLDYAVPQIESIYRLFADPSRFGETLAKALELHARYWKARDAEDQDALLPLAFNAIRRLALERGVPVDVTSDYLPAPLAGGPADEPVVCCPYCVTPLLPGMRRCAACLEDTTRDAPLEVPGSELSAPRGRRCTHCAFPLPELAVRCARCRQPAS